MAQPKKPQRSQAYYIKKGQNRLNKVGMATGGIAVVAGGAAALNRKAPGYIRKQGAAAAAVGGAAGAVHATQYYNRNKRNAKTGVRTSRPTPVRTQGRVRRK